MNFLEIPFLFPIVATFAGVFYTILAIIRKWARAEETIFTGAIALGGFAVAMGLASLDPANPGEALPKVIVHLRDAVIVNVLGMALKIVISKASASNIPASSGLEVNFGPLLQQMAENEKAAAARAKDLSDTLKLGQYETKQSFVQLNATLQGVLSELSKGATKEIITALENVIERFNQNLTTQFGKNFQQLNEACFKLVTWQEQYKEELSRLQTTNSAITENLTKSANALELSAQKTGSFTDSAKQLENLYGNLTNHTQALGAMLEQLRDVPNEAARSIEELARIVKDSQKALEQHNRSMEDKIADFADHLVHEITQGEKQISSVIKESGERFAKQISETGSEMVALTNETTRKVQTDLAATVEDIGQNLKNSISTIEGHNQRVQTALAATVKDIGQSLNNSVSTIEDHTQQVQAALTTSAEEIGQSLKNSVSNIEDHVIQTQEAVHGNLNEALAKFAQIINDALIHSLQNAISASNEAKNAQAKVDSMERRYGGKH